MILMWETFEVADPFEAQPLKRAAVFEDRWIPATSAGMTVVFLAADAVLIRHAPMEEYAHEPR